MESLLNAALANALMAILLALLVVAITRVWRNPFAVHLLWLLVLLKLVTPPVFQFTTPIPRIRLAQRETAVDGTTRPQPGPNPNHTIGVPLVVGPSDTHEGLSARVDARDLAESPSATPTAIWSLRHFWLAIIAVWLVGSVVKSTVMLSRAHRFDRLARQSPLAADWLVAEVKQVGQRMGLRLLPSIRTLETALPPMVWNFWGKPLLLLPKTLVRQLDQTQRATVLAHELTHLQRRDHWVRWLETLVAILYWWHPLVRVATRALHQAEEECCDANVLRLHPEQGRLYSEVLLKTAEFVAAPRQLSLASPLEQAHQLKRRVALINHESPFRQLPRVIRYAMLLLAVAILPLSAAGYQAQTPGKSQSKQTAKRSGTQKQVAVKANQKQQTKPARWGQRTGRASQQTVGQGQTPTGKGGQSRQLGGGQAQQQVANKAKPQRRKLSKKSYEWTIELGRRSAHIAFPKKLPKKYRLEIVKAIEEHNLLLDYTVGKAKKRTRVAGTGIIQIRLDGTHAKLTVSKTVKHGALLSIIRHLQTAGVKTLSFSQARKQRARKQGRANQQGVVSNFGQSNRTAPNQAAQGISKGQGIQSITAISRLKPISKQAATKKQVWTTQFKFMSPIRMTVQWETKKRGQFDSQPLVCPGRLSFIRGKTYRLRLSGIPSRPGVELFPTLTVMDGTSQSKAWLDHSAVPIRLSEEDVDQVLAGKLVTRVLFLPNPKYRELSVSGVVDSIDHRLGPGKDPLLEANKRGTVVAIFRVGNRQAKTLQVQPIEGVGR